jgi:biopolymer transport protein ExbD
MMPMPAGLRNVGVMSEINVTPMIDVMIVLLILFMVVTPVLAQYALKLPGASNVSPETEADVVELAIDQAGAYWVNDRPVPAAELAAYLTRVFAARPGDHLLYLRADGAVGYDRVLDAVDAARAAGVRRIGAITEPARRETEAARVREERPRGGG